MQEIICMILFTEIELRYCCKTFTSRGGGGGWGRGAGLHSGERTLLSPMWPMFGLSLSVFFPVARGSSPSWCQIFPFYPSYDLICLCLKLICSSCYHKSSRLVLGYITLKL